LTDTVACRTVYITDVPYPRRVRRFHTASVVDPHRCQCGSGSSIFGSMCGSGSRFLITQICIYKKFAAGKKSYQKLQFFIPRLGLHEGCPSYRRSLQNQDRTSHTSKHEISLLFSFLGHLFLPGSEIGSSGTKSMRIHDPQHCMHTAFTSMKSTVPTLRTAQCSGNFGFATNLLKNR
jgi:hypothetical protein